MKWDWEWLLAILEGLGINRKTIKSIEPCPAEATIHIHLPMDAQFGEYAEQVLVFRPEGAIPFEDCDDQDHDDVPCFASSLVIEITAPAYA